MEYRKVVRYASVTARSDTQLVDVVNKAIRENGLEPIGGPVFLPCNVTHEDGTRTEEGLLMQALVRYEIGGPL